MSEARGLALLAAIVVLAFWAAITPPTPLSQITQQADGIETPQQPESAPSSQEQADSKPPPDNGEIAKGGGGGCACEGPERSPLTEDPLLAVFTFMLVVISATQGWLLYRQIFATFRPQLTVRNIYAPEIQIGKPITIKLEVINKGSYQTRVRASRFKLYYVTPGRTYHGLRATAVRKDNYIGDSKMVPGAVWRGSFKPRATWQKKHLADDLSEAEGLFLGGKILYRDRLGNQRRLGFFRRFNPITRRFERVAGNVEDFEYDD